MDDSTASSPSLMWTWKISSSSQPQRLGVVKEIPLPPYQYCLHLPLGLGETGSCLLHPPLHYQNYLLQTDLYLLAAVTRGDAVETQFTTGHSSLLVCTNFHLTHLLQQETFFTHIHGHHLCSSYIPANSATSAYPPKT